MRIKNPMMYDAKEDMAPNPSVEDAGEQSKGRAAGRAYRAGQRR
jgi:hypothetical protein